MCLAIPVRVVELVGDDQAVVDLDGVRKEISLSLVDGVQVGDYVILHVGYALTRLDPEEAERTLALVYSGATLDALGPAGRAAFAARVAGTTQASQRIKVLDFDGVFVAGPEGYAYPALWECKFLGAKAWRDLEKNKLAVAKPVYAAQVAMYQAYLDLHANPALFTAINADTMEVYAERVPFDGQLAQRMSDRAVQIVLATDAGELLPRGFSDPTHFECRFCAWQDRCWRSA